MRYFAMMRNYVTLPGVAIVALCIALLAEGAGSAKAAPFQAYAIAGGPIAGNQSWTGTLGNDFEVVDPITITSLGAFDDNADGIAGSITVYIYDLANTTSALASVSISGTGNPLNGQFRYAELATPLTLGPGTYSVIALGFDNVDRNGNENVGSGIPLETNDGDGLITFVNSRFGPDNGTFVFPTNLTVGNFPCSGQPEACFAAGSFEFLAANTAPVAADDAYETDEDTQLAVDAPGVLDNDEDAEDDDLTAILVTDVTNGTLTLNADGSFTYTPNANFNGTDSFTYKANDGKLDSENVATVTITVNAINDAPVANDDSYSTNEDTLLEVAAPGVLGNDVDVDGDMLTAVLQNDVANGDLTLNSDGSFTYSPNTNFNGTDSFTYFADDGTLNSETAATVTITVNPVNDPPVANADAITTSEDTPATIDVLANDTDVDTGDNSDLTVEAVTQPTNGNVINNGTDVTYIPFAGFIGTDTFEYTVTDGDLTDTATVTVTVVPYLAALYHLDKQRPDYGLPPAVTTPDDSGSHLDATLMGDAAIVRRGLFSRALSGDGEGDYAVAPAEYEADFDLRRFTLEFWFNIQGPSAENVFPRAVSKGNSLTNNGSYSVFIQDNGSRIGLRVVNDGDNLDTENTSLLYGLDEWHHVAATYDAVSDPDVCTGMLYFDGMLVATEEFPQPCAPDNVDNAFSIGGVSGANEIRSFNGLIDEVRVWSRVLSEAEVKTSADMGFQTLTVESTPASGIPPRKISQEPSGFPEVVFTGEWRFEDDKERYFDFNFNVLSVRPGNEIDCGNLKLDDRDNGSVECIEPMEGVDELPAGNGVRIAIRRKDRDDRTRIRYDFKIRDLDVDERVEIRIDED